MINDKKMRHLKILHQLSSDNRVYVKQLSEKFGVTMETVRRDLLELEKDGSLKRIHGGAVKVSYDKKEPPHNLRFKIKKEEKEAIAKKSASLIKNGDYIFIDVGTTCSFIVKNLENCRDLTIVTNNLDALNFLVDMRKNSKIDAELIFLGGQINSFQMSTFGSIAQNQLEEFYFDIAFLGVGGITIDFGLSGYEINECLLTRKVMEKSRSNVVLCDSTKVGVNNYVKISNLEKIDTVVSDIPCPIEWQNKFKDLEIDWLIS